MTEKRAMEAYKALRDMESAADLKKAGFTLFDYYEAQEVLKTYARNNGEEGTTTTSLNVALWYKWHDFDVEPCGIGWRIR